MTSVSNKGPFPVGHMELETSAMGTQCPVALNEVLLVVCAHNEFQKIGSLLDRVESFGNIEILVVDDASTDGTTELLRERGIPTIRNECRRGAGAGIRRAIHYFLEHDYEVLVLMAGNDKDRPSEIHRLIDPIVRGEADLVQGSRYLPGGLAGNMPLYRQVASRYVHPVLFLLSSGRWMTDTTNGFRAIKRSVLEDPSIHLGQAWLDHYELEPYLLFKAVRLGYRVIEVPVSKIYPPKRLGYTKMRPITGWWSILRPLLLLGLGLRA